MTAISQSHTGSGNLKGSDVFIRALENEGVQYIFGVPGEENLDLLESLLGSKACPTTVAHKRIRMAVAKL